MNPDKQTRFQQNTTLVCLVIWTLLILAAMIAKLATRTP